MISLQRYVRQAKLHGVEGIYDAAARDLDRDQLAVLGRRLRELDPKWRPPPDEGRVGPDPAKVGQTAQQNGGLTVTNRGTLTDSLPPTDAAARCLWCGDRLRPERLTKRYCTDAHRQKAYRERLKTARGGED